MKQWILRETRSPRIDWHILCHRGVSDPGEVERFMNPDYDKHLNDPYLLSDMERAVGRLTKAIEGDERVGIFADYDADGICSAAVLSDFFKKVDFKNFFIHIPDRNKDGFGLSDDALRVFTKEKVSLLFTLDCGITNAEEVQILNKCGVDIIIVDHHLPQTGALPDAYAIINPKRDGETYPFPYLSGAGLTFKLVDAIMRKGVFNIPYGWEKWLLDLVAIAAVADMVPLIGENRVLVRYGLEVLKKTRRPGLLSLYGKFRLKKNHFSEDDIAFTIAPKINIAGRMGDARESLTLLTTDSWDEAERIVDHLNGLYVDRKEAVNFIMKSIESNFAREEEIPGIILCGDKSWHPGVLGLAANKAVEKYQSPVFLWGQGEGSDIKGSCRTDGSINVVEMMRAVPLGFFNEFGGHESAGGFATKAEKIGLIKNNLLTAYQSVSKQKIDNVLRLDAEVPIDEITWNFYELVNRLSPFGVENPKPIFWVRDAKIRGARKFGEKGAHYRLEFEKSDGQILPAIGFFASSHFWGQGELGIGNTVDLAASVEKNTFSREPELRLRIVDVQLKK